MFAALKEIALINPRGSFKLGKQNLAVSFLPMKAVGAETGVFDLSNEIKLSEGIKRFTVFQDGDILFAKITPCMENGKVALVSGLRNGLGLGSTEFHVIRIAQGVSSKYCFYYLIQRNIRKFLQHKMTGTAGQLRVPTKEIEDLNIPLCSLPEQKRIVAKIESLFLRLDSAKDSLERVRQEIKRYRQSVLKTAFEGKLSKDAAGFKTYKVKEIFKLIDGDRGNKYPKKTDYMKEGYCLFLSTKNVRIDGFKFDEKVYISAKKHKELRNGTLDRGDIVITTRGTLGNVALYDTNVNEKVVRINSGMLILRLVNAGVSRKYLVQYFISPKFTHQIDKLRSGTAQPQLPARVFKEFTIDIPDKEENQNKIVNDIEARFKRVKVLEDMVEQGLKKIERLKQSILKKAFEGKLVEPDPNDEPVEVLLARIKKEKTILILKEAKDG